MFNIFEYAIWELGGYKHTVSSSEFPVSSYILVLRLRFEDGTLTDPAYHLYLGLTDPDNQTIVVSVASCHFHYPPEVDVYEILSGEFLGVFKWLKVLHKRPKDDEIDKIHPDLRLSVKELSVEFQDDPFEVRD